MTSLSTFILAVRRFYGAAHEPLRRRVYTTLLGVAALAVAVGVLAGSTLTAVTAPLALLLAVPAVEKARSQVTPAARPAEVPDDTR